MSKGPKRYTVVKIVRLTGEQAEDLKKLARLLKCSQSEAIRAAIGGWLSEMC